MKFSENIFLYNSGRRIWIFIDKLSAIHVIIVVIEMNLKLLVNSAKIHTFGFTSLYCGIEQILIMKRSETKLSFDNAQVFIFMTKMTKFMF